MIVIGTTLAAFVMDQKDTWEAWVRNIDQVRANTNETVKPFAAIEVDARGLEPFAPLLQKLEEIGGDYWTYSLDDGRVQVTTANRLRHITNGQNLVTDYAVSTGADWLLFMAADCMPPDDIVPRMLEMNHPLVAPYIRTYCLIGPDVPDFPFPVMDVMASAACIMIHRDVFRKIRWRWDPVDGSDDPCYHKDAIDLLGIKTYVRKDVFAKHYPEAVGAIETRGHDMRVVR
jgi:hypothetical protein